MNVVLFASGWSYFCGILLFLVSVFLVLLILVQRGRGGGLTGALGGMGGQSAFGTKAGDMFTRVTMATAVIWVLLCMLTIKMVGTPDLIGSSKKKSKGTTSGPKNPGAADEKAGEKAGESPDAHSDDDGHDHGAEAKDEKPAAPQGADSKSSAVSGEKPAADKDAGEKAKAESSKPKAGK